MSRAMNGKLIPKPNRSDREHSPLMDYDLSHASRARIADVRAWIRRAVAAEETCDVMLTALRIARPYVGRCNGVDASNADNLAQIDAAIAMGENV